MNRLFGSKLKLRFFAVCAAAVCVFAAPAVRPAEASVPCPVLEWRLDRVISVDFAGVHVSETFEYIASMAGVRIEVDESVFGADGKLSCGASPEVTLELAEVPAVRTISVIARIKNLSVEYVEGAVLITSR